MPDTGPPKQPPPTVVIVGTKFAYPDGFGATSRARAYARGLAACGAKVHMVSLLKPSREPGEVNSAAHGIHEGVSFEYAYGTRVRPEAFLARRWLQANAPLRVWRTAHRVFRDGPGPKAVLVYSDQPNWIAYLALLAKAMNAACVVEVCEVPFINERGTLVPAKRRFQDAVAYRLVDGFIVISRYLERYVAQHAPRRARTIRVPILVVASDFSSDPAPPSDTRPREIVFVGYLGNAGEVFDLLAAFATIAPDYPDLTLKIVGDASSNVLVNLEMRLRELGLEARVELAGSVRRQELPALLETATMLALSRRAGLFSEAGFPTKLGEYLASGRPVVVTATGDIPNYLTHQMNAYLAPPGDPSAFAAQMRHVLEHEDEARVVGARGRALALRCFDYRRHGERLSAFFRELSD